ncbi:MAG: TonB-dependent receptor [Pseudarcicella sp.]|nr:TonB-dependent receptor [Pseudarcicella sp.]
MRKIAFVILLLRLSINLQAQSLTQTIKGTVVDHVSKTPLEGATISLEQNNKGAITDKSGFFKITNVPVGRVNIKITNLGYKEQSIANITVISGKETILEIELQEQINMLSETVVKAPAKKTALDKGIVSVSGKTFDIEDTRRYAGSRNDPARMVAGFAGVVGNNDSRNDIIVRGNSPSGILWKLQNVDIPNPSHFGALGATGGPVSMLNNNQIAKSVFLTGAFPAIYGNATSGVFDLQLRNGNAEKYELMGQVGFNGLELGAEGPFSKKNKSSFLVNYRYSVLGIVSKLGIDFGTGSSVPNYQDLSFKLNFPTTKSGTFTLFGLGGKSDVKVGGDDNFYSGDKQKINYETSMGVIGLSHNYFFNTKTSGKITLAMSGAGVSTKSAEMIFDSTGKYRGDLIDYREESSQERFSANYELNRKFNAKNNISLGFTYNQFSLNYLDSLLDDKAKRTSPLKFKVIRSIKEQTSLIQGFANWQCRPSDKLTFNVGVFAQSFLLNDDFSIEPRAGLKYSFLDNQSLSFGVGHHSQLQMLPLYFNKDYTNGIVSEPNKNLKMNKSNQVVLGYERFLGKKNRLKIETYYQRLYNIPVDIKPTNFSALNLGADFNVIQKTLLQNSGTGYNYGMEATLERNFSNHFYYLATLSIYDSKYKGSNNILHNTAFNGNYTANLLAGLELPLGKNKTLAFDTKVTFAGGKRFTPIDRVSSFKAKEVILFSDRSFEFQYKDYFRTDFKITYRVNKRKTMQEWFIDLQNISNSKNIFEQTYNVYADNFKTAYQLGFFPNFNYRIQF